MKSDVLERLLIDRAAGELAPDVEELLEAHLEREPAARREAAEIEETLRLARLALAGQKVVELPETRPAWRAPSWAWAMAACFVCGLLLGIFALRGRIATLAIASVPSQPSPAMTTADESGFWSARRLRAGLSSMNVKTENRVIWKSPVEKPQIL
ncbi:MAG: anti-sigma factor family protein [Limisphaerales bacterium]